MDFARDHSCLRGLNWRTDLPPGGDLDTLVAALSRAGFARTSTAGSPLLVLRAPGDHEILIVPRTGRVQIRVHYLTPEPERRGAAEGIFRSLVQGVLGLLP